jgi:hypothetical protein
MSFIFPAAASVVALFFTASLMRQFLERKKIHQLVWAFGFLLFAVAVGLEAYSEIWGWDDFSYRLYSSTFASLVAFLGCGSVFFLKGKKWGAIFLFYTLLASAMVAYLSFTVSLREEALVRGVAVGARGMPVMVRMIYPMLTIPGSIALIFGSLWSWFYSWRKTGEVMNEKSFNLWIAAGALIVALSGTIAKTGYTGFLYLGELTGIAMMYYGFMQSRKILAPIK